MRDGRRLAGALLLPALLLLAAPASASAADWLPAREALAGLPDGIPRAAQHAEPNLPRPQAWPFRRDKFERFPRTSGTGRLRRGALLWTDFLYDDHGAVGSGTSSAPTSLAAANGTYHYPPGAARENGADLFRVGVGLTRRSSWWRIDWNTLADPNVPIAAFALDTDNNAGTGATSWPGVPGLRSRGVDRVLLISSRGAWLVDPAGGRVSIRAAGGGVAVDRRSRSFVVRLPKRVLRPHGHWRLRVAAGLADAEGDGFAPVGSELGADEGQPPVYNVGFRSYRQEPHPLNFWMEDSQAAALASGDVDRFALAVRWRSLKRKRTTPEPNPRGYLNRWYVSSIQPGQGVRQDEGAGTGDLKPNFLGRVQPYAVYVPRSHNPRARSRLIWILHSLSVMHNQFGALNPNYVREQCERARTICATTLGRGPDGWYVDEAELDFFEVWGSLARHFRLDPDRTVVSGYSMGGFGAYRFGLGYPDLFSQAIVHAGPPQIGLRVSEEVNLSSGFDTTPLVENGRWSRFLIEHGAADELVPVSSVLQQVNEFDRLRYRYQFDLYPAEDHLVWAAEDAFPQAVRFVDRRPVEYAPGHVTFKWYPEASNARLGIGPTGAWWLRGIAARSAKEDEVARIDAHSNARPDPPVTTSLTRRVLVEPGGGGDEANGLGAVLGEQGDELAKAWPDELTKLDPQLGVAGERTWNLGRPRRARNSAEIALENVAALNVLTRRAGRTRRGSFTVRVDSDGPLTLTLSQLVRRQRIRLDGRRVGRASRKRRFKLRLSRGRHTVVIVRKKKRR